MPILKFPPVESANPDGLLALGGDYSVESLTLAYSQGIFPWPGSPLSPCAWYSPNPRGVLFYRDLKIGQSMKKLIRQNRYTVTFNQSFPLIIDSCRRVHKKVSKGTWITPGLMHAYLDLHRAGFAYSVEVMRDELIVGGLYGVQVKNIFSGESMFHIESNTSKIALIALMERLHQHSIEWLDIQMVTPVLAQLGGKEILRKDFINLLEESHQTPSARPFHLQTNFP
jgi:leucyl/phenylalanyl-tRNA--protein transferase